MSANEPTAEQVAATLAAAGEKPVRFETSTGQVYEGTSTDDVIQKLLRAQESATTTIRNLNEQTRQTQSELEQLRQSAQPVAPQNQKDADTAEYWRLLQADPLAANRFALAKDLGVTPEQVPGILRQQIQTAAVSMQNQAGEQFSQRNPDFPATPEASAALVQHMQRRYAGRGNPRDAADLADRLEISYSDMVRQNLIEPADPNIEGVSGQRRPIPSLGRESGGRPDAVTTDWMAQARKMPLDKLKEAIDTLSAQQRRR